ncbi:uncharacterized protein HKW66_Vig0117160 [Vigna angularis]|uniref:Leucine-rich repeat-containing N-terminal plant-type domain-containing protein n=1 Tax=Phaseolus angularis TaxID=3914 RepID=A0A8T0JW16_PHAAN|nr:uncharacterized protein HKW66_Vig0117160 [Vigna angularis]
MISPYVVTLFHLLLLYSFGFSVGFKESRKSGESNCRENERQALLNFKQSLIDHYGRLSTWTDHQNNTDCCNWEGIQCSHQTAMAEKSINRTQTQRLIYGYNITYREIYGPFASFYYQLDITWVWKGVEHVFRDPQYSLMSIDLSCNDLNGEIPKEVVYLFGIVSLNLSRNNLSGEIPSEIGNLSSLESLDLSRNHLHGRIPSSLSQLDFLGKLDLSYNYLSGRIPLERHFQTFEASSFEGNIDLCGEQLNKSCPGDHTTAKPEEAAGGDGDDSVFYEALYMSMGVGFFVGFWGLIGPILIWKPWRIGYLRFLNRLTTEIQL